jgi:hypothetical protein
MPQVYQVNSLLSLAFKEYFEMLANSATKTSRFAAKKRTQQLAGDCRFCREEKGKRTASQQTMPISWQLRKGRGGRRKRVPTEGCFCPNKSCETELAKLVVRNQIVERQLQKRVPSIQGAKNVALVPKVLIVRLWVSPF